MSSGGGALDDAMMMAGTAGFTMSPNLQDEMQDVPLEYPPVPQADSPRDSAFYEEGTHTSTHMDWGRRADLRVAVTTPETVAQTTSLGLPTSYTTYLVQTDTTLSSFSSSQMRVRRRVPRALSHPHRAILPTGRPCSPHASPLRC